MQMWPFSCNIIYKTNLGPLSQFKAEKLLYQLSKTFIAINFTTCRNSGIFKKHDISTGEMPLE